MNLLETAQKNGRVYKLASGIHGGEYHGPCPQCGGVDRFHIWPQQGEHGTFWCRGCDKGGDAIEYLMKFDGLSFPQACKEVGKELTELEEYQAPKFKRPASAENFIPRQIASASELWTQHATKLADWAHQQLIGNTDQLQWLADRGLDLPAVEKYRIGWNPGEKGKDLYRAREAWGLETVLNDQEKPKKLWLPIGLTIPYYIDGTLQRLRIRRPDGEPRYYLVPGSNMAPMILNPAGRAFIIVESELDALLIDHLAGDLVGTISQGNSTAKPDAAASTCLDKSLSILIALDSDRAGMEASVWWKKHFPQAERWPVPVGKDPGEAFKAGIELREWVKAGLPPILTMPKPQHLVSASPQGSTISSGTAPLQDNSGAGVSAATPAESEQAAIVQTFTAKDGRTVYITDDQTRYSQLVAAGHIVFDSREIAFVKTCGADQDQAARFLDAKQTFPGLRVISADPDFVRTDNERPAYQGRYSRGEKPCGQ